MRLISQNGTYDIPYELSSVFIFRSRNSYEIRAFINGMAVPVFMAEYSTEEKAKGVMEMIKEKYLSVCYNGSQVPIIDYFHFPTDEEIEVCLICNKAMHRVFNQSFLILFGSLPMIIDNSVPDNVFYVNGKF